MYRLATNTVLLLIVAGSAAFQANLPVRLEPSKCSAAASTSSTARWMVIMNEEETQAVLNTVSECAEHSQCTIDDVAGLIYELKEQEKEMSARLESIAKMIANLQHVNEKEERQTDEVRAFVRDMLRVFEHGGQAFPTGFAGEIGSGPTTAYDALPPKPWKAADKKSSS